MTFRTLAEVIPKAMTEEFKRFPIPRGPALGTVLQEEIGVRN